MCAIHPEGIVGRFPTSEELVDMMKMVDEDESGEIDLAEFIEFMTVVKRRGGHDVNNVDVNHPLGGISKKLEETAESYEESPIKMLAPGELNLDADDDDGWKEGGDESANKSNGGGKSEEKYKVESPSKDAWAD